MSVYYIAAQWIDHRTELMDVPGEAIHELEGWLDELKGDRDSRATDLRRVIKNHLEIQREYLKESEEEEMVPVVKPQHLRTDKEKKKSQKKKDSDGLPINEDGSYDLKNWTDRDHKKWEDVMVDRGVYFTNRWIREKNVKKRLRILEFTWGYYDGNMHHDDCYHRSPLYKLREEYTKEIDKLSDDDWFELGQDIWTRVRDEVKKKIGV